VEIIDGLVSTSNQELPLQTKRTTQGWMPGVGVLLEQKTLQPLDNPFGPRLLPMS